MGAARKLRYQSELGLYEYDAQLLTDDKATAAFFDAVCAAGAPAKTAANWITGPVAGWLNERASSIDRLPVSAASLAELIGLIEARTVSHSAAQQIFGRMADQPGAQPKALAEALGLIHFLLPAGERQAAFLLEGAHPLTGMQTFEGAGGV
mgnify:CR=1 FL=1